VGSRRTIEALGLALLVGAGSGLPSAAAGGSNVARAAIVTPPTYTVGKWNADTDNLIEATGTIELGGSPVSGVRVRVDTYEVPAPTNARGQFVYLVDHTLLGRHVVAVTDASGGRLAGKPLTSSQQAALTGASGSIDVAYAMRGLEVSRNSRGEPVISGRLVDQNGDPAPVVGLLTYQLTGRVVDSKGNPVSGAQVSTRTLDRDYWTVSTPTDSEGRYSSLFTASSEASANPVPFTVRVSIGDVVYQFLPEEFVYFTRLQSATLDVRLPPAGYAMAIPRPQSYPGAVYTGIVVGAAGRDGTPIRPVSEQWPDRTGRFTVTLPKRYAGQRVSLWQASLNLFSHATATPGQAIDLVQWPGMLPGDAPRDLVTVRL
jgi:hypothetical protein